MPFEPLTSPALLSHRTPALPGEEGDYKKQDLYGFFSLPSLPAGGSAVGERGRGSEGPEAAETHVDRKLSASG